MHPTESDKVLVALANPAINDEIRTALTSAGFSARSAASAAFARDELATGGYAACLIDDDTYQGLQDFLKRGCDLHLIRLRPNSECADDDSPSAVVVSLEQWKLVLVDHVRIGLEKVLLRRENERLREQLQQQRVPEFLGMGPALQTARQATQHAMLEHGHVLFIGERGTGKPFFARAVHAAGRSVKRIHCGILTEQAAGEQLFDGPADRLHPDLLSNDFVVLEEINGLSPSLLERLVKAADTVNSRLRVLATAESVGPELAALTRHWRDITLPPLRERTDDIVPAAEFFLEDGCLQSGRTVPRLTPDAVELLENYPWPGNLVELRDVVNHALSVSNAPDIDAELLQPWLMTSTAVDPIHGPSLRDIERQLIEATFTRCAGNRELTAKTLQIGIRTLSGKLREYGYPPRGGPGSNLNNNRAA